MPYKPFKMLISFDWLRKKNETEPDLYMEVGDIFRRMDQYWTTTPPTEEGLYWMRDESGGPTLYEFIMVDGELCQGPKKRPHIRLSVGWGMIDGCEFKKPVEESVLHTEDEDGLPDNHPFADSWLLCTSCREQIHYSNNECMQEWYETKDGNFCTPCFNKIEA